MTNADGDSVIEASDAAYAWVTTDFPDGDYWVIVTAYDAANNHTRDSMLITVNNMGIEEEKYFVLSPPLRIMPNPNNGSFVIDSNGDVKIVDITGRLIAVGRNIFRNLNPGIYFVIFEKNNCTSYQKVVVIKE